MNKLSVSVSPHIRSNITTSKVMLDVLIALAPATVASVVIFGLRALAVIAVCVGFAILSEFLMQKAMKRPVTISDLSAAITGLLLALNLPSGIPLWQAAIGSIFAIVVVKQLFGGLGHNFANPAITARIMLLVSFSSTMAVSGKLAIDGVSGATPLAVISGKEGTLPSYLQLLLGTHGGALGETCAIALIAGGLYLVIRKVITWHTPVVFVATVFVLSFAFGRDPVAEILSGGLLLGAIFMATDYVTTPATAWGRVIFGFGCGFITIVIRTFGNYPEGVSFSILLMNILTPYIEKWTRSKVIGGVNK